MRAWGLFSNHFFQNYFLYKMYFPKIKKKYSPNNVTLFHKTLKEIRIVSTQKLYHKLSTITQRLQTHGNVFLRKKQMDT